MKALVYQGPGRKELAEVEKPVILDDRDAVVRMEKTTICGTDLHILKGDTPEVPMGLVLGHEGIGTVEEVGADVRSFKPGDRVIVSCISSCGVCEYCRRNLHSHCEEGGWLLGHLINGTQAEYVRTPFADTSLYHLPDSLDDEAAVMLSDILPTGFEIGVLKGQVQPGDTVAVVGAGPVGLATILTSQFFSPGRIIALDLDANRLEAARGLGATDCVDSHDGDAAVAKVLELTGGVGVDVAVEAVGIPASFDLCQRIVAPGGRVATVGVHGKPVELHLENLWIKDVSITTGLVSAFTTPMLMKVIGSGKIDPGKLVTHRFPFEKILEAYDTFAASATEKALKVIIDF